AKMIRPEPDQPFDQTDISIDRSVVAGLGFGEINLLRNGDHAALDGRGRRTGIRRHRSRAVLHLLLFARGLALLTEFESGSRRRATGKKFGVVDLAGAGL